MTSTWVGLGGREKMGEEEARGGSTIQKSIIIMFGRVKKKKHKTVALEMKQKKWVEKELKYGTRGRGRTCDLSLRRRTL